MKALKKILQRNVIGRFCLVLGLFCLLPIAAEAQMTMKERAALNRNRPALWFLSKNKEKYIHHQLDSAETRMTIKERALRNRNRPALRFIPNSSDYNIYKGDFNLLIFGNAYTHHWTYVPQADTYAGTGGATFFTGLGVGFEYAYHDNHMVSLGWSVGASLDEIGCGDDTRENCIVHQIDLLHSWNIKRLTLSAGPTMAWKRWSHWVDDYWTYSYDPETGVTYTSDPDIPAPWNEDFTFRHWSAGVKVKVHFRLLTGLSFGIEYAARRAWEKPFRHHLDHQLTVKSQIRFRLFGKKK